MNISFYIAITIVILLIIAFISLKYYLIYKYTINIDINDNSQLSASCFYNHNINILDCTYIHGKNKYNITEKIKNEIENNNTNKLTFNANKNDLPPGGKLKIKYVCYTCNKQNQGKGKKNQLQGKGKEKQNQLQGKEKQGKEKQKFIPLNTTSISIPNNSTYSLYSDSITNTALQNKYDKLTKMYDLTGKSKNQTNFIPVHSSSTQNSMYWNKHNNKNELDNLITYVNNKDDLNNLGKQINTSIDNNNIDILLDNIELEENKKNKYFINDEPMSSYVNIFSRKYPYSSIPSKLVNIDPEYIIGGLRGDAKLLD